MPNRIKFPFKAVFREDPFGWKKFQTESKGFGEVGALHKGKVPEVPKRFVNEWVASTIAQYLRLPIPAFAITRYDGGRGTVGSSQLLFSSIDFNYERESPPRPEFDILFNLHPDLCAGILIFDIFVANPDRRRDNIWCDNSARPTRIWIYDHDQALFGGEHDGCNRITAIQDKLGLGFWSQNGSDFHPFLRHVHTVKLFEKWLGRVHSVPAWFIRSVCEETRKFGASADESRQLYDFLRERRRQIGSVLKVNSDAFPNVSDWELF